jgi:ethanolamine utilization protein EutQ (cupin superfamily)
MVFNETPFEVEFTETYIKELTEIYEYISNNLKENNIAKKLLNKVNKKVLNDERRKCSNRCYCKMYRFNQKSN